MPCWLLLPPKSWELCISVGSFSLGPSAHKVPLRYLGCFQDTIKSSSLSLTRQVFFLALHLQIGAALLCFFVSKCWLSGLAVLTAVCTPSSLHSQKLFSSHFIILGLNIHHQYPLSQAASLPLQKDNFLGETLAITDRWNSYHRALTWLGGICHRPSRLPTLSLQGPPFNSSDSLEHLAFFREK